MSAAKVRAEFWTVEVQRLGQSLEEIAMTGERLRREKPNTPEPLTLQVKRDQTVALLLRARTELQDAELEQMLAEVEAKQAEMQKVSSATK